MNITEKKKKTRDILYAFNAATSSCHRVSFQQLLQKFVQFRSPQPLFVNYL